MLNYVTNNAYIVLVATLLSLSILLIKEADCHIPYYLLVYHLLYSRQLSVYLRRRQYGDNYKTKLINYHASLDNIIINYFLSKFELHNLILFNFNSDFIIKDWVTTNIY